jgi:hypothetical protein
MEILNNLCIQMENECSICLDKIDNNNLYTSLCGHSFHSTCLNTWFKKDNRCPLCRTQLRLPKVTVQFSDSYTLASINLESLVDKLIFYERKNKLVERKLFVHTKNNKFYIYNSRNLLGYFR